MYLITKEHNSRFADRLAGSNGVDIATARAARGAGLVLDLLCKAAEEHGVKVRTIVGTHGSATHPDVLERLRDIGPLRLVEAKQALIHPRSHVMTWKHK